MDPSRAGGEASSNDSSSHGPIGEALRKAKPDEERLPRRFGEYVLLSKLGEGGFGAVYLAYEEGLHREVAIKLLRVRASEAAASSRLMREAQALAKLDHPNVVKVHAVGEVDGQAYVVMERAKGRTLRAWQGQQPQPGWKSCVAVYVEAGRGLAAAHEAKLVHRDFKPDNCMIDDKQRVRVLDFGLARRGGDEAPDVYDDTFDVLDVLRRTQPDPQQVVALDLSLTTKGAVLGTPAYMPPEHMRGEEADARSDQFSFCVSLYEAVYGERPFADSTLAALMVAVQDGTLRPEPKDSEVPAKLRTLLLRGLAADPRERWPSMETLLAELQRLVAPREWRKVAGVGVGLAAIAGVVAIQQGVESFRAKLDLAEKAQQLELELGQNQRLTGELADRGKELELELATQTGLRAKDAAEDEGRELEAVRLAIEAFGGIDPETGSLPSPVMEGLTHALVGIDRGIALRGHERWVFAVAVSGDGQQIATASRDGTARLWDARSGAFLRKLEGHEGPVHAVSFSSDGTRLATASADQTVRIWDAATAVELETLRHQGSVRSVAFSPGGTRVASASGDAAWVWHSGLDAIVVPLVGHSGPVRSVAFSPDGTRLVTASEDRTARIWDPATGASVVTLEGHTDRVFDVAVSSDGTRIATGGRDQTARLWDATTGRLVDTLDHGEVVYAVAFSPDGTKVATGTFDDGAARVWDVATGRRLAIEHHEDAVVDVAFSPTGDQLVTASWDLTARSWSLQPKRAILGLPHPRRVDAVAFSPDGSRVVTGSGDGCSRIWDAYSGAHLATLQGHRIDVLAVAFSADGSSVATASWDGSVRLWDASLGEHRTTLRGHAEPVRAVVLSPDGTRVATASRDGTARVWDAATGKELRSLSHGAPVVDVVFDPRGQRLVTVGADARARTWSRTTGEELQGLLPDEPVTAVAFSPDGRRIAAVSKDAEVRVWDVQSGEAVARLRGHTAAVRTMTFSRDGTRLATAGEDGTARVWELATQEQRITFPHAGPVTSVAFSPDGTRLATANGDHQARLWSLETGTWVEWGCRVLDARSGHREATLRACASATAEVTSGEWTVDTVEPEVSTAKDLEAPEVITVHGVELVLIPGGTFTMGSPPGEPWRWEREGPQHEVTLSSFYLARTPVTNAQYAVYLEANPNVAKPPGWEREQHNQPEQPVAGITWYEAKAYCDWAGLSLPTEAQWEYAARAGTSTAYWFGAAAPDLERFDWYDVNSGAQERGPDDARARSVATQGANPWGVFDVHGNVAQWTLDLYERYATSVRGGDGLRKEPVGNADRVVRGGEFDGEARTARSAFRAPLSPDVRLPWLGFRPSQGHHP